MILGRSLRSGLALAKAAWRLRHDPGMLRDKALYRLRCLRSAPAGKRLGRVGQVRFEFDFDLDPAMVAMYRRGYEIPSVRLLRAFLRPGSVFLDCGANAGYLSAVALDCVGESGLVHAVEPVPRFHARLQHLKLLNPAAPFFIHPVALGESDGEIDIAVTAQKNIGWNTVVPGFMAHEHIGETLRVPLVRLDRLLANSGIDRVDLIKVDVEGFELPVLLGLSSWWESSRRRPPVLCEVAPAAYPLLSRSLGDLASLMRRYGYRSCQIIPPYRPLVLDDLRRTENVLFLAHA